jgi:ABC-type multidrug transport system fused ATPase/permease subunit
MVASSTIALLARLWDSLSPKRRMQFRFLFLLMILTSFAEVMSIGAVIPFLGALTSPDLIFKHSSFQKLIETFRLSEPSQILLPLTCIFILAAILAGGMRLLLLWLSTRLSFAVGADLSIQLYRSTLYQPYSAHCKSNSSEIISSISTKLNSVIYSIFFPILVLISSCLMLVIIIAVLLLIEPIITIVVFIGFGLIYLVIILLTRKKLLIDSQLIATESTRVVKLLQEGLGGIRDILIDSSQPFYCNIYQGADSALRRAQGNHLFITVGPRYAIEALGMILIAIVALVLTKTQIGVITAIPLLGALALSVQRLLPILQQGYASWTQICGCNSSMQDVLSLLEQSKSQYINKELVKPIAYDANINLKNVSFRYDLGEPLILQNITLSILKGDRIGFIGTTGSGKSTLLDIIMGLLQPTEGSLEVDGQIIDSISTPSWQAHIAHVPQAIFLTDGTILENIAFGVPIEQIDYSLVKQVAIQAKIDEAIESWPNKYQTYVGERGIRLSGGQRQRIGIARALYKQADVIIFDEATSALDSETEKSVMDAINGLSKDLTLLIIAHRLTTLKDCTQIVELENGIVKRILDYQNLKH